MEQGVNPARVQGFKAPIPGGFCTRKHPLLYLNIPKSACTTIKNIMYFIDNGEYYADPLAIHGDGVALLKRTSRDKDNLLAALRNRKVAFTFVREPFARAYSTFNEKIYFEGKYSFPEARRCLIEDYGAVFPADEAGYSADQHSENFFRFLNFVQDTVDEKSRIKLNPHWSPQKIMLDGHHKRVNIDVVGKVENFEQGMRYVLDIAKIDVPVDLKVRFNEGPKPPFKFGEIMTAKIFDRLYDVYGGDVRYLAYDNESSNWSR